MAGRTPDIAGMMLELSRIMRRCHSGAKGVNFLRSHALFLLHDRGPVTLTEFASVMNVSPSTASVFVGRLQKLKLVIRAKNPRNKRQVVISLSPAGRKAVRDAESRKQAVIAEIFSVLPAKDLADLERILGRLLATHHP